LLNASSPSIFPGIDTGYFGAGSVVSSVTDYGKWMLHLLNASKVDTAVAQSESAQMIIPHTWAEVFMGLPINDVGNALGAGFGFDVVGDLFHGQRFFTKGGDTLFHKTRTGFLPEAGVAAVVFSNMEGFTADAYCTGIRNALLEIFTGVSISTVEANWAELQARINASEQAMEKTPPTPIIIPLQNGRNVTIAVKNGSTPTLPQMELVFDATRDSGLPPPAALQRYVGEFHSSYGGNLHVKALADGRLSAHYGALNGALSFVRVIPTSNAQYFLCPNASLYTALYTSGVAPLIFDNATGSWQLTDIIFSREGNSVDAVVSQPRHEITSLRSPYLPFLVDGVNGFPAAETSGLRFHEVLV
jgi:hypothetical protein